MRCAVDHPCRTAVQDLGARQREVVSVQDFAHKRALLVPFLLVFLDTLLSLLWSLIRALARLFVELFVLLLLLFLRERLVVLRHSPLKRLAVEDHDLVRLRLARLHRSAAIERILLHAFEEGIVLGRLPVEDVFRDGLLDDRPRIRGRFVLLPSHRRRKVRRRIVAGGCILRVRDRRGNQQRDNDRDPPQHIYSRRFGHQKVSAQRRFCLPAR